ncbi:MAG: efflux RND transporter periplasmic adaptor subunit [Betaproteobacteria bacterium]|nr:efflux RND transporter periplasmic adaptor subunit [Betaproteobacteria bacterium]
MNKARLCMATALWLAASVAFAHGGEDHGDTGKPAAAAPAPAAAIAGASGTPDAGPQRLADGSVFVPKASQRQMGVRTERAAQVEHGAALELPGRVVPDPNFGGKVQASQAGRVEPGPGGFPALGKRVKKGEVLAWLRPVAGAIERGNQQAQLAEIEAQFALAGRRVRRLEALEGSVPQKEIEAAREELKSLTARRAAVGASLAGREALVAPVSGVVSAASAVAGQVVEARETLFEVVDPQRLMVEAVLFDAAVAQKITGAGAALPGGGNITLKFAGAGLALKEQAIPVLFRVMPDAPRPPAASTARPPAQASNQPSAPAAGFLAVGQPLTVIAITRETTAGIALPQSAVVKNASNLPLVWVHVSPERFVPRTINAPAMYPDHVMVQSGVKPGERVVVEGAALLNQIR